MAPIIIAAAALAGIGAAGYEIANQPSAPKAPTEGQTAASQAQASEAAAQAQAANLTKRRGMASTVLTSPLGAGPASTQKATLGA